MSINILNTSTQSELVWAQERKISGQKSAAFAHDRHQLTIAVDGTVCVENNFGSWIVPTGCGAWIPAGLRHSIEPQSAARVQTLYIWRAPSRGVGRTCAVLRDSPLLRELIGHICRLEVLRDADAAAKRLAAVVLDQIGEQRELPLFVPALRSPLAQRAAAALRSDPADTPRITDLANGLGVSDRTLERAFRADTGMTIGEWRQRTRIGHAIRLLAGGGTVKDVALEVGYETPSAFVTAFKRAVGTTPG